MGVVIIITIIFGVIVCWSMCRVSSKNKYTEDADQEKFLSDIKSNR